MMKEADAIPGDFRTHAEAQLRAAGVRVTVARVSVLAALLRAPSALAHQELQLALADMDRVTLYRSLDCLIAAALAHRIAGNERAAHYGAGIAQQTSGATGEQHRHGHFRCLRCARVFCLDYADAPESGIRQLLDEAQQSLGTGFQLRDVDLSITGWCAECAR